MPLAGGGPQSEKRKNFTDWGREVIKRGKKEIRGMIPTIAPSGRNWGKSSKNAGKKDIG